MNSGDCLLIRGKCLSFGRWFPILGFLLKAEWIQIFANCETGKSTHSGPTHGSYHQLNRFWLLVLHRTSIYWMPIFKLPKEVIRKVSSIVSSFLSFTAFVFPGCPIFKVHKGVIRKVNSIITSLLWTRTQPDLKFHLANLEILDLLVKQGGWGLGFQPTPCQMEFTIWLCSSPQETKND